MHDIVLAGVFAGFLLVIGVGIFVYRWMRKLLFRRHPRHYQAIWGESGRRKNSIDALVSFLQFVFISDKRPLKDGAIYLLCIVVKGLFVAAFLLFVTSALGPFFLPSNWQ